MLDIFVSRHHDAACARLRICAFVQNSAENDIIDRSKGSCAALVMSEVSRSVMPGAVLQASVQCRTCGSLLQAPPGATEIR